MIHDDAVYKIKDSVDLFLKDGCFLTAYYMNTRQRQSFRVNDDMIYLLEHIDGIRKVKDLEEIMLSDRSVGVDLVRNILEKLEEKRIITKVEPTDGILPKDVCERYTRQINYFSEFCGSEKDGLLAQKRVMDSDVLIFGCGGVGGTIALQLAMAGVSKMTLFDYDIVVCSDKARHMFYRQDYLGMKKVKALKKELLQINSQMEIRLICEGLTPQFPIENLIQRHTFVVNTMDEPYIGYTASKISRVCIKYKIAHFIAGGFDAHLASTGELIIPYVTPCVECYATHFKTALKDWKPRKHPVEKRCDEIGGLASMSLFSSSYAGIEIIKYLAGIVDQKENFKIRGEFLFQDFSLTYLDVQRNPDCPVCGRGDLI